MQRFQQVNSNILRGGEPSEEEIKILKNIWGVKKIISLDQQAGEKIDNICKILNIKHIILPILESENLYNILEYLSNNIVSMLETDVPVYIHCVHGMDRTGLVIAIYRIKKGWSSDKALEEAFSLNFGDGLSFDKKELFINFLKKMNSDKNSIKDRKRKLRKIYLENIDLEDKNDAMAYIGLNENVSPVMRSFSPQGIIPYGFWY